MSPANLEMRHRESPMFAPVQLLLSRFCERSLLDDALGERTKWAIVGGAIRDLCLGNAEGLGSIEATFGSWNDLDIAVASRVSQLPAAREAHLRRTFRVKRNTYGGLKMSVPGAGVVDVWHWRHMADLSGAARWKHMLARVDFSINAVSYVPSLNAVVAHPAWQSALEERVVELLYGRALFPELRVVRGLALCCSLTERTGFQWVSGSRLQGAIEWLFRRASSSRRLRAKRYMAAKVAEGRWPAYVFQMYESVGTAGATGTSAEA